MLLILIMDVFRLVLGEGCPFFHGTGQVQVNYFYEGNRFYANASCMEGFYLDVGFFPNVNRMLSYQLIECVNSFWIRSMPKCIGRREIFLSHSIIAAYDLMMLIYIVGIGVFEDKVDVDMVKVIY